MVYNLYLKIANQISVTRRLLGPLGGSKARFAFFERNFRALEPPTAVVKIFGLILLEQIFKYNYMAWFCPKIFKPRCFSDFLLSLHFILCVFFQRKCSTTCFFFISIFSSQLEIQKFLPVEHSTYKVPVPVPDWYQIFCLIRSRKQNIWKCFGQKQAKYFQMKIF